jgi:predicted exporter
MRRAALPIAVWSIGVALALVIVARTSVRSDLSAFLPAHPTEAQQLLVDQLRDGPASRMILCAIHGGDAGLRARISAAVAARLRKDPQFVTIANGEDLAAERDRRFLFENRYRLSAAVTPGRFSPAGLAEAIQDSIDGLSQAQGLLLKFLFPRDPTGEMQQILSQLDRMPGPRTMGGVWVSADGARALIVARTRAAGSDTDGQARALAAIRAAFERSLPQSEGAALQLQMSGPGVFAVAARRHIEDAALRLSILSAALIVALLLIVYRSVPAVLLGLLPVASAALAGVAAVSAGFGVVYGITLGFGITLIGEAVDYSIYFFIQSQTADAMQRWRRTFWPTVRLGMLCSVCGFASLLPAHFPGLAQLGLYSIAGLLTAAAVTRFVLPVVSPRSLRIRDLTPLGAALLRGLTAFKYPRVFSAAVLAGSTLILVLHRGDLWNRDLSALSPVPLADQRLDADLRKELGAADVRDLVVVRGADLQAALRGAEQAAAVLDRLVAAGILAAYESPTVYLPSLATQESRRAGLPDANKLSENLAVATADLAVSAATLAPFVADVAAARTAAPLAPSDLEGTSLNEGFDALILRQGDGRWNALLPLHADSRGGSGEIDLAGVRAALAPLAAAGVTVIDLKSESNALYAGYLTEALRLSSAGLLSLVTLLSVTLRSVARIARVLAPLILAVLCVAALLALAGRQLTILHLIGLLLVVAVGSNYALFFCRRGADAAASPDGGAATEKTLTMASLAVANLGTVIGFGLLAFSQVPVLEALGTTVAPGAFLALLFSALLGDQAHA